MTITDMVDLLEELRRKHGNLDVYIRAWRYDLDRSEDIELDDAELDDVLDGWRGTVVKGIVLR